MNSSISLHYSMSAEHDKPSVSTIKALKQKENLKIKVLRDEKEPHCPLSKQKILKKDEYFSFEFDEKEQRIMEFLENNGIYTRQPIEKYYDYYEKKRFSISSVKASCFSPQETSKEQNFSAKEDLTFTLCSDLYQKRKCITPIQKKSL